MLDQSFSAENFRNIFHIENRKANIKITMFPEKYIEFNNEIKILRKEISEHTNAYRTKAISKTEFIDLKKDINDKIESYKEKKDCCLYEYLKSISGKIESTSFKFELIVDEKYGAQIYKLPKKAEVFFLIKQLQYNIRKTFQVKQSERYHILKQIKLLLKEHFPKYIIRTDIKHFYESIPQNLLLKKIEENTLLNHQSKKYVKDILVQYEAKKTKNPLNLEREFLEELV